MRVSPQLYEVMGEHLMSLYAWLPYRLRPGRAFTPIHAVLELTYRCNLRCEMCFQGHAIKGERDRIDTAGWKRIIDQIPSRTAISLTGGEPTLRHDFRELAAYAMQRHRCHMNTNGTRLDDNLARFIVDGRFIIVGVSIDGDSETHNTLRRSEDAFAKAWSGLERLIHYKKKRNQRWPLIDVKTVIQPHTLTGVSKLVEMVADSGVDLITFSFPKQSTSQFVPFLGEEMEPFYASPHPPVGFNEAEVTDCCARWEEQLARKGVAWRYYPRMTSHRQFGHYFSRERLTTRYLPCYVPWVGFSVTGSGDVYPCLALRYGNLLDSPLTEIWNGTKARQFRQAIKSGVLFPQCEGCCWLRVRPA